jgi:hypothetical protein
LLIIIISIIYFIIKFIRRCIVGAIAVSKETEQQIERLRKALGIPTKAGILRVALQTLEEKTEKERLRVEIGESVRRCAVADQEENQALFPASAAHTLLEE